MIVLKTKSEVQVNWLTPDYNYVAQCVENGFPIKIGDGTSQINEIDLVNFTDETVETLMKEIEKVKNVYS